MKHLFSFLLFFSFVLSMTAQTIVSTTPQNKNVFIEEFTGINCQFCPGGHKIVNDLIDAYPGRVFAANIHTGTYAPTTPASSNYTTAYGAAIAGQTGLTGYPSGTVNRHVFTSPAPMTAGRTAHSVGNFSNCSGQIIAQASPVNVAIDATLDEVTRELSILVEVYYTADADSSTNALNIAVVQDYVLGSQVGSSLNPDYILGNQYYHMHMLRDLIFGQWGFTMPATTAGTFFDTAFVYTIPAAYGAITAELYDLKFIAFVSENRQEVLSAAEFAPVRPLDAAASSIAGIPLMACTGTFSPTFTLTNEGSATITDANIIFHIDSETPDTIVYSGNLLAGQDTVIALPALNTTVSGTHTLNVEVADPNGTSDFLAFNDATTSSFVVLLDLVVAPVQQSFAATTFPPAEWTKLDITGDGSNWIRKTAGCLGAGSAFINFYNIGPGSIDDLISYPADLTSMNNSILSFHVAYRQYSTSYSDKLQVDVSTDCGATWTNKYMKSGSTLATTTASTAEFTSPTASQWRMETVDLSAYDGQSDVLIRFRSTSAYGNNLFLDDINLNSNVSIEENSNLQLSIFPNPATDLVTIDFMSNSAENGNVYIVNSLGEVVFNTPSFINAGNNSITLNTSDLGDGIYFLNIQTAAGVKSSTFVIGR